MSQLSPKFIYFDLDDTLLNHKKAERAGLRDILEHFDMFNGIDEQVLLDSYHDINKALWVQYGKAEIDRHQLQRRRFENTLNQLGLDASNYDEVGTAYMNFYRNHWEWIDGARECYYKITEHFKVGIITNGFAETQWLKIDQFGFKESARQIVISEEVGVMKPDPKIFDHSTELAAVDRSDILYVGDSFTSDVVGGAKAGWKVAWYTKNPVEQGYKLADLIFDDFNALLKALGLA